MSTACATDGGGAGDAATYTHVIPMHMLGEWDPAQMYTREPIAMRNVYETLTYYNAETEEVEPLLASDWEASGDGLEWTFELREDVTFHSGTPLTAEAAAEAIERTIDVEGGPAYLWDPVEDIEAVDEHTLVFDLAYPAPLDLVTSAAYGAFIYEVPDNAEAAVLDDEDDNTEDDNAEDEEADEAEEAENTDSPFHAEGWGTGPYTVGEFQSGEEFELRLEQFADYWRDWDSDHFEQVEFQVVAEEATAAQLVETGQADSVQTLSNQLLESLANDEEIQILETTANQNLFAMLNTETGPLANADLRRAVVHAIDYTEIVEATEGDLQQAQGLVPPGPFGADTDNDMPAYDPDRAEDLLEQAGYDLDSDIIELDLTYEEGEPAQETVAEMLQSQLSDINIDVDVTGLPQQSALLPRGRDTDPEERQDIMVIYWWSDNAEANGWYSALYASEPSDEVFFNLSYYDNEELDEAIAEVGELSATDPEAAQERYTDMEEMILEDAPTAQLGDVVYRRAVREDIEGFLDNPLHPHTVFGYELRRE